MPDSLNQLIVIGNGFDIECGLKTRYSDFFSERYESILNKEREKTNDKLDLLFSSVYNMPLIDLRGLLVDCENKPWGVTKTYQMTNFWDALFCYSFVYQDEIKTWKDVESTIFNFIQKNDDSSTIRRRYTLDGLIDYESYYFESLCYGREWDRRLAQSPKDDNENGRWRVYALMAEWLNSRCACKAPISADGEKHACLEAPKRWHYRKVPLCSGCQEKLRYKDAVVETEVGRTELDADKLRQILLGVLKEELILFESDFCKYILSAVDDKSVEYVESANTLLDQMLGEILDEDRCDNQYLKSCNAIVSFNYTSPFEVDREKIHCLNHVHGKATASKRKNDPEDKELIFGIDPLQGEGGIHIFTKAARRLGYASFAKHQSDSEGMTLGSFLKKDSIDYVKIYGHSLGDADYSYFQSIFDIIDLYGGDIKLCFFGRMKGDDPSTQYSEVNVESVYMLIERYAASFPDKEKGKNLLNKLLFENRLIIQNLPRLEKKR